MAHDPHTELRRLLQQERELLLTGQLGRLPELAARKEVLGAQLTGATASSLQGLRSAASENHHLLRAAQEGLRAALTRLTAIRAANRGLTSYAADGSPRHHANAASTVERRA